MNEEIKKTLEEKLGMSLKESTVVKNGVERDVLIADIDDKGTGAIIYTEDITDDNIDQAVEDIKKGIEDAPNGKEITSMVKNWDEVADKLMVCVGPHAEDGVVRRKVLDIDEYIRVDLGIGTVKVTDDLLKIWNKTADEVFDQARKNMNYSIIKMGEIIREMMRAAGMPVDDDYGDDAPMYVITSESRMFGASAMFDKDMLKKITDTVGDNVYIIPSSIHEVIAIKNDGDVESIKSMIGQVNSECVPEEDVLSNNLYSYSAGDELPQIAEM